MLSKHEEQAERREILENGKRLHEQAGSYFSHTHNDVGGRFSAVSNPTVIGSEPIPRYSGAPNWAHDPVPTEPPLGFDNPALEPAYDNPSDLGPSAVSPAQGNSGDPTAPSTPASSRSMSERGSPSLSRRAFRRF